MLDQAQDKGPLVLGVVIATLSLGSIFVISRLISRAVLKPELFGWDDTFIIITWLTILAYAIDMIVSVGSGYGKHIGDLDPRQLRTTLETEVLGQVFAIVSFPPGKASIAYLLQRIFPSRRLKWFLWSFVTANALLFYIDAILILVQCQPVKSQWDRNIKGTCWKPSVVIDYGFLTGVVGAITDCAFALVPWVYIRKLSMPVKEKIMVGFALSVGIVACVCSIIKIYYTWTLGTREDFTYDTCPLVIWSSVELCAINIAACIPTLRPLYLFITGKEQKGSQTNSRSYGSRLTGNSGIRMGRVVGSPGGDHRESSEQSLHIYHQTTYDVTYNKSHDDEEHSVGPEVH